MRISIRVSAFVYEKETEKQVEDCAVVLAALDGWHYELDSIYNYLDSDLVDQGVLGGNIRAIWRPDRGLELVTDYWAPDSLKQSSIDQLRDETVAQMSDGIGEGGFEVTLDDQKFVLVPDLSPFDKDYLPEVECVYDGKSVPIPSKIARAARSGDMDSLRGAVASGEAIDSTIQGCSGLHLAILYGFVDVAILLISKGANVNLSTSEGETPLHLCALSRSLNDSDSAAVARTLLSHSADKTLKTPAGHTAAYLAEIRQKKQCSIF